MDELSSVESHASNFAFGKFLIVLRIQASCRLSTAAHLGGRVVFACLVVAAEAAGGRAPRTDCWHWLQRGDWMDAFA